MKRFLLLIPAVFCLIGCRSVGDEEYAPASLTLKTAPASLGKTFSSASIGNLSHSYSTPNKDGKSVWLLLFERKIPWKERPASTKFKGYAGSDGPITLLIVEPNNSAGKNGWSLLNTIPLGVVRGRKTCLSMRWLEPEKRRGPVLFVNKLFDGMGTSQELIAFPDGWKQANPIRQTYINAQGRDGAVEFNFYAVDNKGFMCVTKTRIDYPNPESITKDTPIDFRTTSDQFWDGNGWKE